MPNDLKTEISANRIETKRLVEQIRANPKLSAEGKCDAIDQVYQKALERHRALVDRLEAETQAAREKMHAELFAPSFTIGQPDYVRANLRGEYRRNLAEADELLLSTAGEGAYNV